MQPQSNTTCDHKCLCCLPCRSVMIQAISKPDVLSFISYLMSFISMREELTYLGMSIIRFNVHNVTNASPNDSHFSSIRLPHTNYCTKSPISEIGITCFERHLTGNNNRAIRHKRSSIMRKKNTSNFFSCKLNNFLYLPSEKDKKTFITNTLKVLQASK